ncbi:MAG: glutathione ABC transporter permease GsiC [Rhodobacterales bacterium]|nr:glutathione ABC transporter permease GsiC [Rhodobacterales bacterium]|tara:strand:+ start:3238 stop:4188 length:951 start_codon:yes stop_codon:yes gene_type:complete
MFYYLFKRILYAVPVLLGVTFAVFLIISLIPGDPATAILGSYATPENVENLNRQLGLDKPFFQRYLIWVVNILQGDFGTSYSLNRPVIDEVVERFQATLILSGSSFLICSIIGIFFGIISSALQYSLFDKIITFSVILGISIPSFFLGMMMILLFTVELKLLPASGMYSLYGGGDLIDLLKHLIMPSTALAIVSTGVVVRLSRSIMLEILRLDFIRTARSKGLKEYRVIFIHAFRLAIVSILPILGLQAGFVLSGAVYIEIVFQWPGVGRMLVDSILTRDIMLVQGGVLFVALCYVIFNIVVDFLQLILDPRIREE